MVTHSTSVPDSSRYVLRCDKDTAQACTQEQHPIDMDITALKQRVHALEAKNRHAEELQHLPKKMMLLESDLHNQSVQMKELARCNERLSSQLASQLQTSQANGVHENYCNGPQPVHASSFLKLSSDVASLQQTVQQLTGTAYDIRQEVNTINSQLHDAGYSRSLREHPCYCCVQDLSGRTVIPTMRQPTCVQVLSEKSMVLLIHYTSSLSTLTWSWTPLDSIAGHLEHPRILIQMWILSRASFRLC